MTTITPAATTAVTGSFVTTPSYSGTFIPTLWSGKLNVKFYATTVFGEIANTAYEGEIKGLGDSVIINNIPDVAISDYSIGQSLNYQVPTPNTIELQINKAKYFGVTVSDVLELQSQPKLMDMFTGDAAKQMAITIDKDILLNSYNTADANNMGATAGVISQSVNLGTDSAPVTLSSTSILPLITGMSAVLDEQNVPETDRWLVITPHVRNILMQSPLAQAYVTGDSQSILRNGKIGTIDRFTIYVSNLLPRANAGYDFFGNALAGAVARTAIMAGHTSGITFASQIAKVESLQNPNDFGTLVRGLNVYGYKTIKPTALTMALVA